MKTSEALALVNEIERTFPVPQWRLHGVQIWPVIRSRLIWAAFNESVGEGWAGGGTLRKIGRRVAAAVRSASRVFSDLQSGYLLQLPADAIVMTDGVAVTRIGGAAYDVVADPLAELIRNAGASVNTWYTTYSCPPERATTGVLVQWRLDAAQVGRLNPSAAAAQPLPGGYADFLGRVQAAGLPQEALALERMAQLAARVAAMAARFEIWLRKSNPRLVFVNCYYTLEGAALMLACKRRGVLSVDVQHGVQGNQHVAYGSWVNVPASGYDLLPRRFWCWSEREAGAIEAWSGSGNLRHRALVGGNLWMEMWQEQRAPFVVAADECIRALLRPNTRTVLVTLQWGMTDAVFTEPLLALIAAAGAGWSWWVRLHPVMRARREEIRAQFAARGINNVLLDEASDFSLPALLKRADVHLTHSSSAVLEAAALGVPSVVTEPAAVGYFPDLATEGMVIASADSRPEAIISALQMMSARRHGVDVSQARKGPSAVAQLLAEERSSRASS